MLKNRIAGLVVASDSLCVQSIGFGKYLPIGKPEITVEFLNNWGIDEIIYLDITATKNGKGPDFEKVKSISKKCFVPLTVGGGISTVSAMQKLVKFGADKVALNSALINDPSLISKAAAVLGNQCIVVSIDVKKILNRYCVFSYLHSQIIDENLVGYIKKLENLGAGEILLNNVDRDGIGNGYDLNLLKKVADNVEIPVIACGGAGHPDDFLKAFKIGKVNCAAAGNYFHFSEHSVITTKAYLRKHGINLRLETQADYKDFKFTEAGRIDKMSDSYLADQRFTHTPVEVI